MKTLKEYNVWFQDGHIMMTIQAKGNKEARDIFNKYISIKQIRITKI